MSNIKIYNHPDGSTNCAVDDVWISALFSSPEAAASWDGHWDEAEKKFRILNPPSGKGDNLLGKR